MITKFIEATNVTRFNWGKFMLARFTSEEWSRRSAIGGEPSLLWGRGWSRQHILVWDMQTGEGAIFLPGGLAAHDLNDRHQIWVCPMYEPFLVWLYQQDLNDLEKLPDLVNLGHVETALAGYRRKIRNKASGS